MNKEEAIKRIQYLIERCNKCKIKQCENCEISWNDVQAIETALNYIEELEKENGELKAIKETIRYLEDEGCEDELYFVVGKSSFLSSTFKNFFNDYMPKQVILELKEKVHETLETNAMTRFHRIVIEDYFDEILKGENNE